MNQESIRLSNNAIVVLSMIADGSSYEQILAAHPYLKYPDIFAAAKEALSLQRQCSRVASLQSPSMTQQRERYPRAYMPWTAQEDQTLEQLLRSGLTIARVAGQLQRNRGAIRSRVNRLALAHLLTPKERARFDKMM